MLQVNRVVALLTALLALAGAVAPVVLDADWQSTAGIIAGLAAVSAVAIKWLDGWQKHEAAQAAPAPVAVHVDAHPDPTGYDATDDPYQEPNADVDPEPPEGPDPLAARDILDRTGK